MTMPSLYVCIIVSLFQRLNHLIAIHETGYEYYAIRGHLMAILLISYVW